MPEIRDILLVNSGLCIWFTLFFLELVFKDACLSDLSGRNFKCPIFILS